MNQSRGNRSSNVLTSFQIRYPAHHSSHTMALESGPRGFSLPVCPENLLWFSIAIRRVSRPDGHGRPPLFFQLAKTGKGHGTDLAGNSWGWLAEDPVTCDVTEMHAKAASLAESRSLEHLLAGQPTKSVPVPHPTPRTSSSSPAISLPFHPNALNILGVFPKTCRITPETRITRWVAASLSRR